MGEIYQFVKAEAMARDQERTSGKAPSNWKGRDGSSNWKGRNVSPYPGRSEGSTTSKESSAQQRGTEGGWGNRGQSPGNGESRGRSPSPRRGPEGLRCYKCQGIGHISRDCPSPYDFVWGADGKGKKSEKADRDNRGSSSNSQGVPARPAAAPRQCSHGQRT